MRSGMLAAVSVSLAALLLGPPPAVAAPRTHVVVMDKMKVGPVPAGIRAGDAILWVNRDMVRHTATARDGSFNVDLPPGARGRSIVKAGIVAVICKYHPGMRTSIRAAAR